MSAGAEAAATREHDLTGSKVLAGKSDVAGLGSTALDDDRFAFEPSILDTDHRVCPGGDRSRRS